MKEQIEEIPTKSMQSILKDDNIDHLTYLHT
jgi:hypothetical protein